MTASKQVFFSLNHQVDKGLYRQLLQWLALNQVDIDPWTTEDLRREDHMASSVDTQNDLIQKVANSDYVVLIVGETGIEPESQEFKVLNAAAWMKRPLIALNVNQLRDIDRGRFPSLIADQLVLHIPMEGQAIKHALESWRDEAFRVRTMGQIGPVHYTNEIYQLIEETCDDLHEFVPEVATPAEPASRWGHYVAA